MLSKLIEIKNSLKFLSSEKAEEWMSEVEDKSIEITQSEDQRQKNFFKKWKERKRKEERGKEKDEYLKT